MNIEISEKEKTALSLLLGLNQKFSREARKDPQNYTSRDLKKLFGELLAKINRGELRYCDSMIEVLKRGEKKKDEIWDVVDEAVERSTIERFDWNSVFGRSLTQEILHLKKEGLNVHETLACLEEDQRVQKFLIELGNKKEKALKNLKISVHARYGENNTAKKVEAEE